MLQSMNNFDLVLSDMKATNKKQIFKNIARAIYKNTGLGETQITMKLASLDKNESTSIGHGITMPHIKVSSLTQPFIAFTRITNCNEFDSIDGQPVDMICCILCPEVMSGQHLQRVASMSRLLSNESFCDKLRSAKDPEHIRQIMMDILPARRAA